MALFHPEFDGELTLESLPDDFTARIQRRVEVGLLVPGRRDRADYHVRSLDGRTITFAARGIATTYNIGLNEVTICRGGRNQLQYHAEYWGWTRIAVAHGAVLGLLFVACFLLVPAVQMDIASYRLGGALFWGMVAFWALVWPWILSAFHRGPAERALQRILREALREPLADQTTADTPVRLPRAS
jgi:hypothetical protein